MAIPAHHLIQDQNLNILYNGITPGGKTDIAKPINKGGGLGRRKALNDISNAKNVISIGKDPVGAAGKGKVAKVSDKGKTGGGRKALSDLTNSVKQPSEAKPVSKMGSKLETVAEKVPSSIMEEGFLHNHQECIKAWIEAPDKDFFLKSAGLNKDIHSKALQVSPMKRESNVKHLEIKEMPELLFEDQAPQCMKPDLPGNNSPACRSPKPPYMNWEEDNFSDLRVIDSPKLFNL